jgi:hypothetical protein
MKLTVSTGIGLVATLLIAHLGVHAAEPEVNTSAVALDGLSSTKDRGLVKVVSDPTLADGRLVLRVVAFNRADTASSFGPGDVKVFTAAGQPVPLMSLDQLVQETRAASSGSDTNAGPGVDAFGTSGPPMTRDAGGRPDVSRFTGGSNSMGAGMSIRGRRPDQAKSDDPKLQQQITDLKAAILQPLTIAPASAAGGQIVTQKIKFGRKEEHALRVVVELNGEQHEFNFPAPPTR